MGSEGGRKRWREGMREDSREIDRRIPRGRSFQRKDRKLKEVRWMTAEEGREVGGERPRGKTGGRQKKEDGRGIRKRRKIPRGIHRRDRQRKEKTAGGGGEGRSNKPRVSDGMRCRRRKG